MNNPHNHSWTTLTEADFYHAILPLVNKKNSSNSPQQSLVENPVQNPAQNLWNSRGKLCAKNLFNARFCNIQWKIPAPWKSCAKFYHYFSTWKIPLLKSRFSTFST